MPQCKNLLSRPTWPLWNDKLQQQLAQKPSIYFNFHVTFWYSGFLLLPWKTTISKFQLIQWGMEDTKNPSWSFFIYWHGTLKNYVPLMELKEGKQRSRIHTGGAPIHGLERYVPTNRVSFLTVSILKQDIIFALGGILFAVWSLKCLLFKPSYTSIKY